MFRNFSASPALRCAIDGLWSYEGAAEGEHRVLPDGCIDLIWIEGMLWVAGPDTRGRMVRSAAGARYAAVRFVPGVGAHVLRVSAAELTDQTVALRDLWPALRVRDWEARLEAASCRVAALQALARSQLEERGPPDRALLEMTAAIERGSGVDAAAKTSGHHVRTLHRRCLEAFGYGPKALAKILRFQRALSLARTGLSPSAVAACAGYADQSHLCRDVRALAGVPLRVLIAPA